jgi:hypothetical protein
MLLMMMEGKVKSTHCLFTGSFSGLSSFFGTTGLSAKLPKPWPPTLSGVGRLKAGHPIAWADNGAEPAEVPGRDSLPGIAIADGWGRSIPETDALFLDMRDRLACWTPGLRGGLERERDRDVLNGEVER